jgi:UDP-N-acetylmuramoyl-tripeptide--D-alanyl-D-alanine ligase
MELSIKNMVRYNGNKILIMGDMYELGAYSLDEHLRMLKVAAEIGIKHIWLVGSEFAKANETYPVAEKVFADTVELRAFISNNNINQSTILLKGSRAMKLEQILDVI